MYTDRVAKLSKINGGEVDPWRVYLNGQKKKRCLELVIGGGVIAGLRWSVGVDIYTDWQQGAGGFLRFIVEPTDDPAQPMVSEPSPPCRVVFRKAPINVDPDNYQMRPVLGEVRRFITPARQAIHFLEVTLPTDFYKGEKNAA